LYYFPSGSWRQQLRGTNLAGVADKVATPFPWSETELRRLGVDATFVGHPLLDLVKPRESARAFAERIGLSLDHPIVGLLPGSRPQEIEVILPAMLLAAARISARVPGVQFLLALAPTVRRDTVQRHIERIHERLKQARQRGQAVERAARESRDAISDADLPPVVATNGTILPGGEALKVRDDWRHRLVESGHPPGGSAPAGPLPLAIVDDATYDVMAASDVLLTTSGTATLEAAILNKPMVIVYRMSSANWLEFQFIKHRLPPHIGLPNLLLGRRACPELVQDAATPGNLAQEVIALLLEPERLLRMKNDLKSVVALLGEPGGARRTAEMVIALAEQRKAGPQDMRGTVPDPAA
jgi:lipid-A-disaccharide synthase